MVVLEYMDGGDLQAFLQARKVVSCFVLLCLFKDSLLCLDTLCRSLAAISISSVFRTLHVKFCGLLQTSSLWKDGDFIDIALDVLAGLRYLESKKFVHR